MTDEEIRQRINATLNFLKNEYRPKDRSAKPTPPIHIRNCAWCDERGLVVIYGYQDDFSTSRVMALMAFLSKFENV